MLFNSFEFAGFFVIVTALYFALPGRSRGVLLLAASCVFYMAFIPRYILILAFTIAIDYTAGLLIENARGRRRVLWLIASIVANVSVLAFFKYFNFINDTLRALALASNVTYSVPALNIVLPIGLSFHTFQSMSYTIEVYRGHQPAEPNFLRFGLYVMFYPQLVAGPIERPQNLLRQLASHHTFDYTRVTRGLQLMAWGLFKKVAIADRLADGVNVVYGHLGSYSGPATLAATYLFAIQIYCDFSGYSDIAIGAAQVMGFRLMQNFDRPYASQSISEFWRRWHISLSTWFRDYVYVPLGGNRTTSRRRVFNLMTVFTLSGLWHGANWTFVIWGALNGAYLVASVGSAHMRSLLVDKSGLRRVPVVHGLLRWAITFHLILLSWIFFRAPSVRDAMDALASITTVRPGLDVPFDIMGGRTMVVLGVTCLLLCEALQSRIALRDFVSTKHALVRWPIYVTAVVGLLILGNFASEQQFIYFQF